MTKKHPNQKRCRKCNTTKNLCRDFSQASGYRSLCRECSKVESRAQRQTTRVHKYEQPPSVRTDHPLPVAIGDVTLAQQVKVLLAGRRSTPWSMEELSDQFNVGIGRIRRAVEQLADQHVNVCESGGGLWVSPVLPQSDPTVIPLASLKGQPYLFGLTGDNHLCSKYSRLDILNALFDLWADQGVKTVYQLGNMIDGEARFNKGDLIVHGFEGQIDYFVEHWPQRKGIVTEFITGDDHEGWYTQREHVNVGKAIEQAARAAGRTDLKFLGHMEHDIILQAPKGKAVMRLIHAGGGSAYATSYSVQKIVESYSGGEKPQVLLVGHYHKAEYGYPREVHTVQCAATQAQTPFLRKNKIQSHLGGWTIRFQQSDDGLIHGFTPRFDPFYDRAFYEDKQWKYQWKAA